MRIYNGNATQPCNCFQAVQSRITYLKAKLKMQAGDSGSRPVVQKAYVFMVQGVYSG